MPSVIPVSHDWLLGDMQQHGLLWEDLGSGDFTVRNHSAAGGRQFSSSLPHATVPSVTYTLKGRGLCVVRQNTFPISTIFHSPAALAFWFFCFTTQQKRTCYHLCSCRALYDQATQTTEFGSKVILFPLGDYC